MHQTGELPVTRMKIIELLVRLQELDFGPGASSPGTRREAEALRQEIPTPILGHYDRLVARGKKAVALVRHEVCTGCQMRLPSGVYAKLLRDDDLCVCDNCARYLMLAPQPAAGEPPTPAPARKRATRRRPSARAQLESAAA